MFRRFRGECWGFVPFPLPVFLLPVFRSLRFQRRARSKFNGSRFKVRRFNGSTVQRFNGSGVQSAPCLPVFPVQRLWRLCCLLYSVVYDFGAGRSRFKVQGSRFDGSRFDGSTVQAFKAPLSSRLPCSEVVAALLSPVFRSLRFQRRARSRFKVQSSTVQGSTVQRFRRSTRL